MRQTVLALIVVSLCILHIAYGQVTASADATLLQDVGGALANSKGDSLFVGYDPARNNLQSKALIKFDTSALVGTMQSVSVSLYCRAAGAAPFQIGIYKVSPNRPWLEGNTVLTDINNENLGGAATANDPTWTFYSYNTLSWGQSGGDASLTYSATATVSATGWVEFSSATLVSDVNDWITNPGNNGGWIIAAIDATSTLLAFNSKDALVTNKPTMTASTNPPATPGSPAPAPNAPRFIPTAFTPGESYSSTPVIVVACIIPGIVFIVAFVIGITIRLRRRY